ncbi:MAG: hydroxymethylglutaryl-CoA synthase [Oenococcus sp.]|uniref:hydroxymethylglutaryl-CoA synthase n=1 Tax=Oenococcus sp. TaxID=1979414 RepID=UPI0039E9464B
MKIGIDKIAYYTPEYYLDLVDLAHARGVDPNKYLIGLMQKEMSVAPLDQDTVTMAANAADQILSKTDKDEIGLLILATESGIDQSKAAALYVQELLHISSQARVYEIKEACYGATAALTSALDYITNHPSKKALIIASDIVRYGLNTPGEVTQGAGAVAMLISTDPKIVSLDGQSEIHSEQIMDFWRPNYAKEALADGHYSQEQYLKFFQIVFKAYMQKHHLDLSYFSAMLFHLPYAKLAFKALNLALETDKSGSSKRLSQAFPQAIHLNQKVGNIYTASLYLSLISLLQFDQQLKTGDKIAAFSYGSGAVAEFFTLTIEADFEGRLSKIDNDRLIGNRKKLSIAEYERAFQASLPEDGSDFQVTAMSKAPFKLLGIHGHKRVYGQ